MHSKADVSGRSQRCDRADGFLEPRARKRQLSALPESRFLTGGQKMRGRMVESQARQVQCKVQAFWQFHPSLFGDRSTSMPNTLWLANLGNGEGLLVGDTASDAETAFHHLVPHLLDLPATYHHTDTFAPYFRFRVLPGRHSLLSRGKSKSRPAPRPNGD